MPLDVASKLDFARILKDRLDEYIQRKADFLAEITTEPLTTTKAAFFYRDVILPFVTNPLLMDNLGRNEGVCYRNDGVHNNLTIRVLINGQELRAISQSSTARYIYPDALPYTLHSNATPPEPLVVTVEDPSLDVEVALPGPLGEYALYAFLENLIRNAAKHNRDRFSSPDARLTITVCINEPEGGTSGDHYRVTVFDGVSSPTEEMVAGIQKRLKADIVVPGTGGLRKEAWGLAEMKICAALLGGGRDLATLNRSLTAAFEADPARLEYRFRILKPKKLCALVPGAASNATLRRAGVHVLDSEEALWAYLSSSNTVASFDFFVLDARARIDDDRLTKLLPQLPFRIIVITGDGEASPKVRELLEQGRAVATADPFPGLEAPDVLLAWAWQRWLPRWLRPGEDVSVELFLEQGPDESPTQEWVRHAGEFNARPRALPFRLNVWTTETLATDATLGDGRHVLFDRHRGLLSRHGAGARLWDHNAYVLLDKGNSDFLKIFQPAFPSDGAAWTLPYELLEAGLLRVLVIDERVAEHSLIAIDDPEMRIVAPRLTGTSDPRVQATAWHAALAANVYVCTHLSLNAGAGGEPEPIHRQSYLEAARSRRSVPKLAVTIDTDGDTSSLRVLCSPTGDGQSPSEVTVDMVIIHQGILDAANIEAAAFLQRLQRRVPFLVVDSGRGIPPTLPSGAKFLPYSLLHDYVSGKRAAKYSLVRAAMALSRRSGKPESEV